MENGKKFTINTTKNTASAIYIKSITLNGVNYKLNTISYKDIARGGSMNIILADKHAK
jgi:putative alpha-1,2-mannosidase